MKVEYENLEVRARAQAVENMESYGRTNRLIQLAIMQEQLGKLSRANTHNEKHPKINLSKEYNRLYHLMSMCYTYWLELECERVSEGEYSEENLSPGDPRVDR